MARTKTKLPRERPHGGRKLWEVTGGNVSPPGPGKGTELKHDDWSPGETPASTCVDKVEVGPHLLFFLAGLLPSQLRASDLETGQDVRQSCQCQPGVWLKWFQKGLPVE